MLLHESLLSAYIVLCTFGRVGAVGAELARPAVNADG